MATLLDGADQDQQTGGVAPGLLNEGAPVSNDKGPLGVLFPSGPYSSIPGLNLGALRRSQLLSLGARLLASSAPKPQGTSSALGDVGQAVGGAMEDWRQMLPQAGNAAMQLIQFQYQMAGRQALMKAMQEVGPAPSTGSPAAMSAWATKVASLLSRGGPAAQPFLAQFSNLAETFHRSASDLHYEEGVTVTPEDVQKNPELQPHLGEYGTIGREAQTGNPVLFSPKPPLNPEQLVTKQIELRKAFKEEIGPGNNTALAYKGYKAITGTDKLADQQRGRLVSQMLGQGGSPPPGMSIAEAGDLQKLVTEFFTNAGRLDDASRRSADAIIERAAGYWKRHNTSIHDYYTHIAPKGIDTSMFEDEWTDLLNPASPAPRVGPAPAGRVTKAIGSP